ncbi:hypothetical protein [Pseudomonas serbica]|uniref:hypothetical protein n=1 Tax=Pseudomonas serbica TaxID=2965074 RepID=UPI00237ACB52|nr:hypothetical protein [Pseudomonas serbica]
MTEGSGMSYYQNNEHSRVVTPLGKIADLRNSFYRENEKRKGDPFSPAIRSKGEKARNRSKRK